MHSSECSFEVLISFMIKKTKIKGGIYRQIQGTPAENLYKNNDNSRILLKCLLSLAFVPETDVIKAFEELQDSFENYPDLLPIVTYFEDNYIGREYRRRRLSPRFAISLWNMNQRVQYKLPRTNNAVEGWHRAFQTSAGASHPSIYNLIEKLQIEQSNTEIILSKILGGEIFPLFSSINYKKVNDRIENIISDYEFRPIIEFLKGVGFNLSFN